MTPTAITSIRQTNTLEILARASGSSPGAERLNACAIHVAAVSPTTTKTINNFLKLANDKKHPVAAGIAVMLLGLQLCLDPLRAIGLETIYIGFCILTGKQIASTPANAVADQPLSHAQGETPMIPTTAAVTTSTPGPAPTLRDTSVSLIDEFARGNRSTVETRVKALRSVPADQRAAALSDLIRGDLSIALAEGNATFIESCRELFNELPVADKAQFLKDHGHWNWIDALKNGYSPTLAAYGKMLSRVRPADMLELLLPEPGSEQRQRLKIALEITTCKADFYRMLFNVDTSLVLDFRRLECGFDSSQSTASSGSSMSSSSSSASTSSVSGTRASETSSSSAKTVNSDFEALVAKADRFGDIAAFYDLNDPRFQILRSHLQQCFEQGVIDSAYIAKLTSYKIICMSRILAFPGMQQLLAANPKFAALDFSVTSLEILAFRDSPENGKLLCAALQKGTLTFGQIDRLDQRIASTEIDNIPARNHPLKFQPILAALASGTMEGKDLVEASAGEIDEAIFRSIVGNIDQLENLTDMDEA